MIDRFYGEAREMAQRLNWCLETAIREEKDGMLEVFTGLDKDLYEYLQENPRFIELFFEDLEDYEYQSTEFYDDDEYAGSGAATFYLKEIEDNE